MNNSKIPFPQSFIELMDDIILEAVTDNDSDLVDNLLELIEERIIDCQKYFQSSVDVCTQMRNKLRSNISSPVRTSDTITLGDDVINFGCTDSIYEDVVNAHQNDIQML